MSGVKTSVMPSHRDNTYINSQMGPPKVMQATAILLPKIRKIPVKWNSKIMPQK
jgi:hypothetical protein